ncbi:protein kinase [Streptomyces sp. NPDC001165]|uniref:protein kinase domain-containing protein n=1 Tax=Streptomyces sp. NPDC001165 TaxID=3364546 RepID=UPI0036AB84E9
MSERIALLLGIDKYSSPLESCVKDVDTITDVLNKQSLRYDIRAMRNEEVTQGAVYDALFDIRREGPQFCLVYFSGHGCHDEIDSYVCTHDGRPHNEGIPYHELIRRLPQENDQSWVVILDCCHAGAVNVWDESTKPGLSRSDIKRPSIGRNHVAIAACDADSLAAAASATSGSFFTSLVSDGLSGLAANPEGAVTPGRLWEYTWEQSQGLGGPEPEFQGDLINNLSALTSGLPPRGTPSLGRATLEEIHLEAQGYIDDYRKTALDAAEVWNEGGWDRCRRDLEPLIEWLDKKSQKYSELGGRDSFQRIVTQFRQEASHLAILSPGLETGFGRVKAEVGSGGFGVVWQLEHSDGVQAYKIFHPEALFNAEKLSRFRHGYEAMKKLSHPNIVKVHRYTKAPVGIVMDYIDGPDLKDLGEWSDPESTILFLSDIAAALIHAHDLKVIHRDIKPENIIARFVNDRWVATLTDFDLAWFPTATHLTRSGIGYAEFSAPELSRRRPTQAARKSLVDIYSFGQVAYFMITGSKPAPAPNASINVKVLDEALQRNWPRSAAVAYVDLYSRATEEDPNKRYQSFREIEEAILHMRRQLKSPTPPPGSYNFDQFIGRLASNVPNANLIKKSSNTANIASRSGDVKIEIGHFADGAKKEIAMRLSYYWLYRGNKLKRNREKIKAMHAACPDASIQSTRIGYWQLSWRVDAPLLDDALLTRCANGLRAMVSAAGRT